MKICSHCKSVNAQESSVCYFCGAALPEHRNANVNANVTADVDAGKAHKNANVNVNVNVNVKKPQPKEMTFWDAIGTCMGKYASFKGRATRMELWSFVLFYAFVIWISAVMGEEMAIFSTFALLLPLMAAIGRRLHDLGRGRWWMFLLLIILFYGWVVLLIMLILPSQEKDNEYGPYVR